jgi:transcriptional regulator with XRE-family HTH domain
MNAQLMSIKAKKFGVRLTAFRQKKGVTTEILSQWTGIAQQKLIEIEQGESTISLPEIELIALKMGLETESLIEGNLRDLDAPGADEFILAQYAGLRDRMIALKLRKSRLEQNIEPGTVADHCGLELNEIDQYETGNKPVPLPILECLCAEYQISIPSLIAQKSTSKASQIENESITESEINYPEEVNAFINNPANLPYLELARKLSELDAAKLRSIAEGLLEITY